MTKYVISGASGSLGRKITEQLLEKIPAENLSVSTRTPSNLDALSQRGVAVHAADYNDPAALERAYAGSDVLMLISSLAVTKRVPEHRNAINAAKRAGIKHIVYTSTAGIHPQNPTLSASDHIVTEDDLRRCGIGYTIMRNACYAEVFPTVAAQPVLRSGEWVQIEGNGKLAPISKNDIARTAVACMLDPARHNGAVYEVTGPDLVSFRDIAAMASEVYGVPIRYVPVSVDQRYALLDAMGVPRQYAEGMDGHPDAHLWCSEEMVTADIAFQAGYHGILTHHVEFITGQKPRSLREVFELCKGKDYNDC
ncbi:SDR family oxidoreductase [Novosphingobium sp.]|uniref:SDR family oxidoreductase n=1 Tax=Novosphingobium sp. TaxID=1874826 RepID=UPI002638C1D6|nr:SDR family oxidoreductase [Novosphingobium sp.]